MKPTDLTLTNQLRLRGSEISLRQELLHFEAAKHELAETVVILSIGIAVIKGQK